MRNTFERFTAAINAYVIDSNGWDTAMIAEMRSNREDIHNLRSAFTSKYKFTLLDVELALIWQWHSSEWDASWLTYTDFQPYMQFFDEFVDRYAE